MTEEVRKWDKVKYHGRYNKYPFTEVVSFVMSTFGSATRSQIKILDLGCGGAHHLRFLAEEGFDYYGVDGSKEAIEIADSRLKELGFNPEGRLQLANFDQLPYEEGTFDLVIDRGSLTCNPLKDIPPLINEIERVTKKGGLVFSMILNVNSSQKEKAEHLGNNDYAAHQGRLEEGGVIHYTDTEEMKDLYKNFAVEKVETITRREDFSPNGECSVVSWSIATCRKK